MIPKRILNKKITIEKLIELACEFDAYGRSSYREDQFEGLEVVSCIISKTFNIDAEFVKNYIKEEKYTDIGEC